MPHGTFYESHLQVIAIVNRINLNS